MLIISSKEFRDNQKKYLDMVDQDQQVIIQRGKEKAYALVPISKNDKYFMSSEVIADIQEGIAQYKTGKTTKIPKSKINDLLGL